MGQKMSRDKHRLKAVENTNEGTPEKFWDWLFEKVIERRDKRLLKEQEKDYYTETTSELPLPQQRGGTTT